LKHPWIESCLGRQELDVLHLLKRHFDSHTIMNPGCQLGLDVPDEFKRV
jgi:alkyldihydroxyacetonephosphate synthase